MAAYGPRALCGIGALLAFGVLAFSWWTEGQGSAELASPEDRLAQRERPLDAESSANELVAPKERVRATRDAELVAPSAPASAPPPAEEKPTPWVEVREAASGAPLPGSRIFVLGCADPVPLVRRLARSELSALEAEARQSEQILVTDAEGRAAFRPAPIARWLFCERGEDFASAFVPANASAPVRLDLEPSAAFEIRVIDRRRADLTHQLVELVAEAIAGSGEGRVVDRVLAPYGAVRLRAPDLRARDGVPPRLWLRIGTHAGATFEHAITAEELAEKRILFRVPTDARREGAPDQRAPEVEVSERRRLVGWLQLENGDAAAELLLCVRLRSGDAGSSQVLWHGLVRTAKDGALLLDLPILVPEGRACALDGVVLESSGSEIRRVVSIPWSAGPPRPTEELGLHVLVARRMELLASGVVYDDVGLPVEGASIEIQSAEIDELCGSAGPLREALLPSSTFRSGANGLFELRGAWLAQSFRLRASKDRYGSGPHVEVGMGSAGVTLGLVREAAVEGRLLCDADLDPRRVRAEVWGAHGRLRLFEIAADGSFLAARLPPQEISLRFHAPQREAIDVGPIATRPGTTTTEKCLQPVDLRGEVRFFELELRARDGGALAFARGALAAAPVAHGQLLELELDAAGRAKVLLSGSTQSWFVAVEGHLPTLFEEREGHATLELAPARRVVVRCEPALELPPAGRGELHLRVAPPRRVPQTMHAAWLRVAERCGVHLARVTDAGAIAIVIGAEEAHETHWVLRGQAGAEQSERGDLLRVAAGASMAELAVDLAPLRALYAVR